MKTFLQLAQVRGPYCECGCNDFAHERHHCLIPQINKGGKVKYPILDDERNLVLVNHHEHTEENKFKGEKWAAFFWKRQVKRYGIDAMMEWLDEVHRQAPKLAKERFNFVSEET
jgi:hypothetical protein